MKSILLRILSILPLALFSQTGEGEIRYIKSHAKIAIQEMEIYKIPASITLAQGLHESAFGTSELAQNANNHFGIKCKDEWKGRKYHKVSAEYYGGRKTAHNSCFRSYATAADSYRDHSKFLAERPYYTKLFTLPEKDYRAWAYGLKSAGYATDPSYPKRLIYYIETYQLNRFDHINSIDIDTRLAQFYPTEERNPILVTTTTTPPLTSSPTPTGPPIRSVQPIGTPVAIIVTPADRIRKHLTGNRYIIYSKNDQLSTLAKTYKVSEKKLLKYNDLSSKKDLVAGQYLFLGKKEKKGVPKNYTVQSNDGWYSISQKQGIRYRSLRKYNRSKLNTPLKEGTVLRLR